MARSASADGVLTRVPVVCVVKKIMAGIDQILLAVFVPLSIISRDICGQDRTGSVEILGQREVDGSSSQATWTCRLTLYNLTQTVVPRVVHFEWYKSTRNGINTNLNSGKAALVQSEGVDSGWRAEMNQTLTLEKDCERFALICAVSGPHVVATSSARIQVEVKAMPIMSNMADWVCLGATRWLSCGTWSRGNESCLSLSLVHSGQGALRATQVRDEEAGKVKVKVTAEVTFDDPAGVALSCLTTCADGVDTFTTVSEKLFVKVVPCKPTIRGPARVTVGQVVTWTCFMQGQGRVRPTSLLLQQGRVASRCPDTGRYDALTCSLSSRIAAAEEGATLNVTCRSIWEGRSTGNESSSFLNVTVNRKGRPADGDGESEDEAPAAMTRPTPSLPKPEPSVQLLSAALGTVMGVATLYLRPPSPAPLVVRCRPGAQQPVSDRGRPFLQPAEVCGNITRKTAADNMTVTMASCCIKMGQTHQSTTSIEPAFNQSWTATSSPAGSVFTWTEAYFQVHTHQANCSDQGTYGCEMKYFFVLPRSNGPRKSLTGLDQKFLLVEGSPGPITSSAPRLNLTAGDEVTLRCEGDVGGPPKAGTVRWRWEWRDLDLVAASNGSYGQNATTEDHSGDHARMRNGQFVAYTRNAAISGDAASIVSCQRREWSEVVYAARESDGVKQFRCYVIRDGTAYVNLSATIITRVKSASSIAGAAAATGGVTWSASRVVAPAAILVTLLVLAVPLCYAGRKRQSSTAEPGKASADGARSRRVRYSHVASVAEVGHESPWQLVQHHELVDFRPKPAPAKRKATPPATPRPMATPPATFSQLVTAACKEMPSPASPGITADNSSTRTPDTAPSSNSDDKPPDRGASQIGLSPASKQTASLAGSLPRTLSEISAESPRKERQEKRAPVVTSPSAPRRLPVPAVRFLSRASTNPSDTSTGESTVDSTDDLTTTTTTTTSSTADSSAD